MMSSCNARAISSTCNCRGRNLTTSSGMLSVLMREPIVSGLEGAAKGEGKSAARIDLLDERQRSQIVFRRGFKRRVIDEGVDEMLDGSRVRTNIRRLHVVLQCVRP